MTNQVKFFAVATLTEATYAMPTPLYAQIYDAAWEQPEEGDLVSLPGSVRGNVVNTFNIHEHTPQGVSISLGVVVDVWPSPILSTV